MSIRILARLAFLSIVVASQVAAQRQQPESLNGPTIIPLRRGPGLFRTIRVRVGNDSADYLFDTGGGVTVVSPQDSAIIGCTPGGKGFGVRFNGEPLSGRVCANVSLGVGPLDVTNDAGVLDLARLLGDNGPKVRGLVSLQSFRGRLLTIDLANDRLILETPQSLASRVRDMTPVDMRLATGVAGGDLDVFVGVRATNGARLWLEFDSGNLAGTLLVPATLAWLGGDSTAQTPSVRLPLGPSAAVTEPVVLQRNMIHDGLLSARFLARAVWTLDLDRGRMWVGPFAELPAGVSRVGLPQ
jgi:hypothetical protein